jgi:hypothetical protein|tara:strand:- start:5586 stop:6002 length:417 start_codon:yes stop_codon:yes gene_type:complete
MKKNTVPKILRGAQGALKGELLRDAPERYKELLNILGRSFRVAQNARWEEETDASGKGKLEANCTLMEAMQMQEKFFNMASRLVEHNTGRPSESKEITQEKRLIIQVEGSGLQPFKLAAPVIEAEVKELVEEGVEDAD